MSKLSRYVALNLWCAEIRFEASQVGFVFGNAVTDPDIKSMNDSSMSPESSREDCMLQDKEDKCALELGLSTPYSRPDTLENVGLVL